MAVIKDLLSAMIEKINSSVKTVNGVAADEKGNVEVDSGVSSWSDLTDKPFGEETKMVPITWDGDIGSKKVKEYGSDNGVCLVYPGVFPTPDDLIGSTVNVLWPAYTEEGQTPVPISVTLTEDMIEYLGDGGYCFNYSNVVYRALVEVRPGDGLYLMYMTSNDEVVYYVTDIDYLVPQTVIEPINTKYLPEHLQFGEIIGALLDNITLIFSSENYNFNVDPVSIPDLIRGETYIVIWDGVEYECVAVDDHYGGEALGNFAVVGEGQDTGEPFFIYEEYNEGEWCGVRAKDEGSHTFSIIGKVIKTIDPKYLPYGNAEEASF